MMEHIVNECSNTMLTNNGLLRLILPRRMQLTRAYGNESALNMNEMAKFTY